MKNLFFFLFLLAAGCARQANEVVVYASQDQTYAEQVLRAFTEESGIPVRAVYDSESVKTAGLVNRLAAESQNPRCDLFWSNEEMLARTLASKAVLSNCLSFGCRTRRLVFNTNSVSAERLPRSLLELTNETWKGRVVLAYPLFGTTAGHFIALRQKWGEKPWLDWCRGLAANKPFVVDGNSVVVKLVGRGEAWVGLTDSDDVAAGQADGLPVAAAPLSSEFLGIGNSAGIVAGAPHPEAAAKLQDYLRSPAVLAKLIEAHALEAPQPPAGLLTLNWSDAAEQLQRSTPALKELFVRSTR